MYILTDKFFYENIVKKDEEDINIITMNIDTYYTETQIPKAYGTRTIYAIQKDSELYVAQKNILKNFLSKIPLPVCVKGFCIGGSYSEFLNAHKNQKYYLRIDIKDFFDSITEAQIIANLHEYVKSSSVLLAIVELCTYYGVLPQGAVTSPTLSNIIFRRIDQRITKYCQKVNVIYTRYADDLIFSSNNIDFKNQKWFYKKIKYILKQNGFKINTKKNNIQNEKLVLNGFVVKSEISLSRKKLNNINKIIFYFKDKSHTGSYEVEQFTDNPKWFSDIDKLGLKDKNNKDIRFSTKYEFINYLCGYRSFLLGVLHANGEMKNKKVKSIRHKVEQIQKIIDFVEEKPIFF